MPKYKNIRVKKPNGGYRTQRVQVLASGKYKFVKNKGRSTTKRKRTYTKPARRRRTTTKKRTGGTSMARRKRKIPLFATAGMGIGLYTLWKELRARPTSEWGTTFTALMFGYGADGKFDLKRAKAGIPIALGIGGSMVAAKTGANRYTTGIPLIKL